MIAMREMDCTTHAGSAKNAREHGSRNVMRLSRDRGASIDPYPIPFHRKITARAFTLERR